MMRTWVLYTFTFSWNLAVTASAQAAFDSAANPNSGLFGMILGVIFWGAMILSALNIILQDPIRGTAKVLSYVTPFVIGFGLPIYLAVVFELGAWTIVAWIGSWFLAYQYINLHVKLFPEDDRHENQEDES